MVYFFGLLPSLDRHAVSSIEKELLARGKYDELLGYQEKLNRQQDDTVHILFYPSYSIIFLAVHMQLISFYEFFWDDIDDIDDDIVLCKIETLYVKFLWINRPQH